MDKIIWGWNGLTKGQLPALISCLLLFKSFSFAQTTKTAILGTWLNEERAAKIEIYQQGGKFFGKIVWLKEPYENGRPKTDNQNPDKARHSDPIIGLVMMKNFVFDGKSTWHDGTIYDARSGKTYDCYLILQADNMLKVRGYVGVSWIGKTNIWTKVN
jgi:uncharacterized protein (DUF2147 family)